MALRLRPGAPEDAQQCGTICYEAFKTISEQHNFPPDFSHPDVAVGFVSMMLSRPECYSVVAEFDGEIVGSNFLFEDTAVAGIGPITIAPKSQNGKIGRALMNDVLERGRSRNFAGIRLVQAAYHNRSLALYTKLGFDTREPLSTMQGPAIRAEIPGYDVRPATEADLEACNRLCRKIHGHDRALELRGAIQQGTATVVEHAGRITGYATSIGFIGHAVAESNTDLKALIGAAEAYFGPGFLLPTRNSDVLRWCLEKGLHVVQPMTLMSLGLYSKPAGAFLPSVLY